MARHIFVDESKAKGYVLVAASLPSESVREARRSMSRLIKPGQRSLHMKQESGRRRREIMDAVCGLRDSLGVTIILAGSAGGEWERRRWALDQLVTSLDDDADHLVTLDLDETMVRRDRQALIESLRRSAAGDRITHRHATPSQEALLCLPMPSPGAGAAVAIGELSYGRSSGYGWSVPRNDAEPETRPSGRISGPTS